MSAGEMPPEFWTDSSAEIAAVDPADLAAVWKYMRQVQAQHEPGQHVAIGVNVYERLCSPGANVKAVWYRASMLGMLDMVMPGWMRDADASRVMKIAASFPMKNMEAGVVHHELPLDLPEFLKQVGVSS